MYERFAGGAELGLPSATAERQEEEEEEEKQQGAKEKGPARAWKATSNRDSS